MYSRWALLDINSPTQQRPGDDGEETTRHTLDLLTAISFSMINVWSFFCVLWARMPMLSITWVGTTKMTRSMTLSFKDLKTNSKVVRERLPRRKSVRLVRLFFPVVGSKQTSRLCSVVVKHISQFVHPEEKSVVNVGKQIILQEFAKPEWWICNRSLQSIRLTAVVNRNCKLFCMLQLFDGPSIEFKLDTGANVNRISSFHLNKLSQMKLRKTAIKLKPYGIKNFLKVLGVVELKLLHPKELWITVFFFQYRQNIVPCQLCSIHWSHYLTARRESGSRKVRAITNMPHLHR